MVLNYQAQQKYSFSFQEWILYLSYHNISNGKQKLEKGHDINISYLGLSENNLLADKLQIMVELGE